MMAGAPIPPELQPLPYKACVVELGGSETDSGLHGMLLKLLVKNVPVLICGISPEVSIALQSLERSCENEELHKLELALYRPDKSAESFLYSPRRLVLLSKVKPTFKVCGSPQFVVLIVHVCH